MTGGILEYEVILDFIIEFHRGECFVQGRRRLKHYQNQKNKDMEE